MMTECSYFIPVMKTHAKTLIKYAFETIIFIKLQKLFAVGELKKMINSFVCVHVQAEMYLTVSVVVK